MDPTARRHALRFEVSAETLATFREMMARVRRDAGAPLDDDAALLLVARQVLGGPRDEGRASYQVVLTRCEACGRGLQEGRGELVEVDAAVVAMAECDAQHVLERPATANGAAAGEPRAPTDTHVGAKVVPSAANETAGNERGVGAARPPMPPVHTGAQNREPDVQEDRADDWNHRDVPVEPAVCVSRVDEDRRRIERDDEGTAGGKNPREGLEDRNASQRPATHGGCGGKYKLPLCHSRA